MSDKDIAIQFENAVRKALGDFKQKLEQQRFFQIQNNLLKKLYEEQQHFFQIQNNLLKKLYEEVKISGYCHSKTVDISIKASEKIANTIIKDSRRLEKYHEEKA